MVGQLDADDQDLAYDLALRMAVATFSKGGECARGRVLRLAEFYFKVGHVALARHYASRAHSSGVRGLGRERRRTLELILEKETDVVDVAARRILDLEGKLTREQVATLVAVVADPWLDESLRGRALLALGKLKSVLLFPVFQEFLDQGLSDRPLSRQALIALLLDPTVAALPTLRRIANEEYEVRGRPGQLDEIQRVSALTKYVLERAVVEATNHQWPIARAALNRLVDIGDRETLVVLEEIELPNDIVGLTKKAVVVASTLRLAHRLRPPRPALY